MPLQTPKKLYLVLDFINGGHLFFQLYRQVGHAGLRCAMVCVLPVWTEHSHLFFWPGGARWVHGLRAGACCCGCGCGGCGCGGGGGGCGCGGGGVPCTQSAM